MRTVESGAFYRSIGIALSKATDPEDGIEVLGHSGGGPAKPVMFLGPRTSVVGGIDELRHAYDNPAHISLMSEIPGRHLSSAFHALFKSGNGAVYKPNDGSGTQRGARSYGAKHVASMLRIPDRDLEDEHGFIDTGKLMQHIGRHADDYSLDTTAFMLGMPAHPSR